DSTKKPIEKWAFLYLEYLFCQSSHNHHAFTAGSLADYFMASACSLVFTIAIKIGPLISA
ncbi:hypothetical protein, partial [Shewanella sp. 1180_01]|uniref:hypothetical protein n=1 Tax=Shewanella sp. 1180_01 TaxID=2604451 RepID=UPI004063F097